MANSCGVAGAERSGARCGLGGTGLWIHKLVCITRRPWMAEKQHSFLAVRRDEAGGRGVEGLVWPDKIIAA